MRRFFIAFVALLSVQTVCADKLVLLDKYDKSMKARVDYISTAQNEIKVQYYTIDKDEVSLVGLSILKERADHGIKVKIIVDSLNNFIPKPMMAVLLTSKNIEIREYNKFNMLKFWRYSKRMHDKDLIIDGKALITGGRNIANGYFGKFKKRNNEVLPVREDADALALESPAVQEGNQYFDDLWATKFVKPVDVREYSDEYFNSPRCSAIDIRQQGICELDVMKRQQNRIKLAQAQQDLVNIYADYTAKNPLAQNTKYWEDQAIEVDSIRFLYDDPVGQNNNLEKPENGIAAQLYEAIAKAQTSVTIITPYFVVTPEQAELFKVLNANHVKIQIITNGENSSDVKAAYIGYLNTRELALREGAKIWEYNGPDSLHAKMVLIDFETLFIGSFNWDYRSQNLNREVGILAQLPKRSNNDDLTNGVYTKLARIFMRSTELGKAKKLNLDAGELTPDEFDQLTRQSKNKNSNALLWRILYPLIKKQL